MGTRLRTIGGLAAAAAIMLSTGCDTSPAITDAPLEPDFGVLQDGTPPSADVLQDLAEVRSLSASLRSVEAAAAAGYDVLVTACRDNPPLGGMGYHYANIGRIEGAAPNALEPEILVFAPERNGKLGLAAVEYLVPYPLWGEETPPTLFGETFRANDNDGVWQLHVWLWRHNPAGLFEDWNPDVSCD